MRRGSFLTSLFVFIACSFFLWMFFAAATLERTADLGFISAAPGTESRALAYEFAAKWRHGMSGNSPVYMPGFFAAAIAIWFWCGGRRLLRMLAEGLSLLGAATVCAALLAPYATPSIVADFIAQERVSVAHVASSWTWIALAQGVYSLLTWTTVIIASRWSIRLRSFMPLLVPLGLNIVLALVRPWTVAEFTSQWIKETIDGVPVAVFSFLLVPVISALLLWVELRPKCRKSTLLNDFGN